MEDIMRRFLRDRTVVDVHPAATCTMKQFFVAFETWCRAQEFPVQKRLRWGSVWREFNIHCTRSRTLLGIGLVPENSDATDDLDLNMMRAHLAEPGTHQPHQFPWTS